MLYSFLLKTDPVPRNIPVNLRDGDRKFRFMMRTGHTDHYYVNIPVDGSPDITCNFPNTFQQLAIGGAVYLPPQQVALNRGGNT